jgi:hypothetical protein
MSYVQIRVSKDSCLDKVLQEMSKEVWLRIKGFVPIGEDSTDYYFRLREMITRAVNRRVHKYPNCGLTEECHDEIEGGPWMDYNDKIYMLTLEDNLEEFIKDIANRALDSIINDFPGEQRSELFGLISGLLNRQFGKYLYFNPVCRHIPFCRLQLN